MRTERTEANCSDGRLCAIQQMTLVGSMKYKETTYYISRVSFALHNLVLSLSMVR